LQVKHHVVQAVVMVMLLARLLQRLSFQDRISLITTAFMRSFPDVAAFFCAPCRACCLVAQCHLSADGVQLAGMNHGMLVGVGLPMLLCCGKLPFASPC
jgi:hypothetical protein